VFVNGYAKTNVVNSCAGDSAASEGGLIGFFGGNDDTDNSGTMRYTRIEFAGVTFATNNEANGLTMNGVGSQTRFDFIQCHRSSDDLIEFFGGVAQVKNIVLTYGQDDGFDWQLGYRGKAQFVVIRQLASDTGAERGIEADNNEFSNDTELCSGRSNPYLSNFTILGDLGAGPGLVSDGIHLRRGTSATIINSIISDWKSNALEINGSASFNNHCNDRAAVAALTPPTFCSSSVDPDPIVFDGNIVFQASGGLYGGTAAAGSPCIPGVDSTTTQIATVQYLNNTNVDPQLTGAFNVAAPNWQPTLGGPAYAGNPGHGKTVNVPKDGFFEKECFVGAVGPEDWTTGWTYYGLDGSGRTFPVRPVVVVDNHNFYEDRVFSADSNYLVRGQMRVKAQAKLTIAAGTFIFQETSSTGTMIVERGGFIDAQGTAAEPIVLTSDAAPGSQTPGGIGGLFINGYAKTNVVNSCAGDSAASEGGLIGFFGGNDDADSSGVIRYLRSEFAGVTFATNNEANGLTLNGVGSRTVVEYVQVHRSSDDLFECFGGTAQAKRLVLTYGQDDGFDWQLGYRGKAQFVVIRQLATDTGAERGIEADNNEFSNATELCSGRSNPTLANFTILGDLGAGPGLVSDGIHLRRGTSATILNSIIANWKSNALEINGAESFRNHCQDRELAYGPGIQCSQFTTDVPSAGFGQLAAFASPNPVRNAMQIRFVLPVAGQVDVEVYGADGRLVRALEQGTLGAGQHTVSWDAAGQLPAGTYFYRVRANGQQVSGKFVRVQ
jgi:hypothetical protein